MFCVDCFKSLGIDARFKIYSYLRKNKSASVNEFVEFLNLSQPTVSYHLHNMLENGLLKSKKQGKKVFFSIRNECPHDNSVCVLSSLRFKNEN